MVVTSALPKPEDGVGKTVYEPPAASRMGTSNSRLMLKPSMGQAEELGH